MTAPCGVIINNTVGLTKITAHTNFAVTIKNAKANTTYHLTITEPNGTAVRSWDAPAQPETGGGYTVEFQGLTVDNDGTYNLVAVEKGAAAGQVADTCVTTVTVDPYSENPQCGQLVWNPALKCCYESSAYSCVSSVQPSCRNGLTLSADKTKCLGVPPKSNNPAAWQNKITQCPGGADGIQTAIGCVPTSDFPALITILLKFAFGVAGAVIALTIISTGYTVLTSAGNPEKIQAAKESVVSVISGVILIAFSLVLLHTIGADILHLPTF